MLPFVNIICYNFLKNLICNFTWVGEGWTNLCKLKWLLCQRITLICSLIYLKLHLNCICEDAFAWLFSTVHFMFLHFHFIIITIFIILSSADLHLWGEFHREPWTGRAARWDNIYNHQEWSLIIFIIIGNGHIYNHQEWSFMIFINDHDSSYHYY